MLPVSDGIEEENWEDPAGLDGFDFGCNDFYPPIPDLMTLQKPLLGGDIDGL